MTRPSWPLTEVPPIVSGTGESAIARSLNRVRIVLVEPTHPGNVGASARAMKAMGLARMCLVAPERIPSAEATARAAGADDVLHRASIVQSLDEAVADCGFVLGTTARTRHLEWPVIGPREGARRAVGHAVHAPVAVVFGRERSGLTNEEVDRCQALIRIPSEANFSSLNVAAAVQVVAYELRLAALGKDTATVSPRARDVTSKDLEGLFRHLEETLVDIGYLDPAAPRLLMRRLRRLFGRASPDRAEINILRGILSAASRSAASARDRAATGTGGVQPDYEGAGDAAE